MPHGRHGNTGFFGGARTGPDEQVFGTHGCDVFQRNFIVAADNNFLFQLAEILHDVVGEAVVVINKQKHINSLSVFRLPET